jgi:HD-like signal output (HDOD) protein
MSDKVNVTAPATHSHAKEKALAALGQLPPFSPILNRLIASLAQEDVSFARVADLIEKDTVLAGNILGIVNSALYGLRGTVNSIRHAVSLLGINKLRNAMLSMSVARMWGQVKTPPGCSIGQFNLHSVAVAILADLAAQRLEVEYAEGAFAAGLFHDLGLLLIALGLPEEYKELARLRQETDSVVADLELKVLGFTHSELTAEALAAWNLPVPIQNSVRFQDNPDTDPTSANGKIVTLSKILHVAHHYVEETRISPALLADHPSANHASLESLQLGAQLPTVLGEFESEFAAIKPYF